MITVTLVAFAVLCYSIAKVVAINHTNAVLQYAQQLDRANLRIVK